jgi:nucleoside-diphosphate-sugar epimerase
MKSAVVLGGSGFVGERCVAELHAAGWSARTVSSPRLSTRARRADELADEIAAQADTVAGLADKFVDVDLVVNSGGIAVSNAPESDELFGANAILPGVTSLAAGQAGVRRLIHLSSISVQGRMDPLDETMRHHPNSPYSASRALGELAVVGPEHQHTVILRLPGVHDAGRQVTRTLNRVARSPLSSTAGRGDRPTPLVLLDNVSAAVAFLAAFDGPIPKVVLPPAEDITTDRLLQLLSGRQPRHIPVWIAKSVTSSLLSGGKLSPSAYALGRRLELMWLGQRQSGTWMADAGFRAPVGVEGWSMIGQTLRSGVTSAVREEVDPTGS